MANRVVMRICGEELAFLAEESPGYMQRVGAYANEKIQEALTACRVGKMQAAMLGAVNIADELFKIQEQDEQLRSQIKGYLDESARNKAEISELKREIVRLQKAQRKLEKLEAAVAGPEASESEAASAKPKARSRVRAKAKVAAEAAAPVVEAIASVPQDVSEPEAAAITAAVAEAAADQAEEAGPAGKTPNQTDTETAE